MISQKVSLQTKFITPIIVVSVIFIAISLIYFNILQQSQKKKLFEDIQSNLHTKVDIALSKKGDVWITNALQMSINPELGHAISNGNREAIDHFIGGIGKTFKQNTNFKNVNVQIIDKELKNFYRSWAPEKYGDSADYSDAFREVIKTQNPLISIEESCRGLRLKGIYPIYYNKKFLGILNFEGGINNLGGDFKKEGIDFLYFLDKQYAGMVKKKFKEKEGYLLNSNAYIDKEFESYVMESSFSLEKALVNGYSYDDTYFIVPVPLKDFEEKKIGIALMSYPHSYIEGLIGTTAKIITNSSLLMSGIVITILIIVVLMLIFYVSHPLMNSIGEIREGSEQITSASDQIANASISLAETSTQQAASVEEINATIQTSTEQLNQSVENSKVATKLAQSTNESAIHGSKNINQMTMAMKNINESSQKISKIIKSIDEIAFQTNLLALNAAVEAARAGEHGLGFAVVADEVKSLAQRSADSAKETAEIIRDTIEQIEKGSNITLQTSESFEEILNGVKKTSNIIEEITISIEEQSSHMQQISTAVSEVDKATQNNAASSEEAAASAEELSAQATSMLQSVQTISDMLGLEKK